MPKPIDLSNFTVVKFGNADIERNYINDILHALAAKDEQLAAELVNISNGGGTFSIAWGTIEGTLSSQVDLQDALNAKANLSGATFTGPVSAATLSSTTQSPGDNSTKVATTAFVAAATSGGSSTTARRIVLLEAY